ncbi:MAG: sensor histidine kinase [Syntrophothermus sp.]
MLINKRLSGFIIQLTSFPFYADPEDSRRSRTLHIANAASFTGIFLVLFLWIVVGEVPVLPLVLALVSMAAVYLLNRSGRINPGILLWLITILSLTCYFSIHKDGSHDSSLFILPSVFIFSALTLKKSHYFALVFLIVFSVNLIIWLESWGILITRLSHYTSPASGIDITITLTFTAYVIFIIVQRLIESLNLSTENEKRILGLLQEKETILKEVHHRIKNNMQSIYHLLLFQAEQQPDSNTSSALKEAAGRLNTMMVLYRMLYQNNSNDSLNAREYLSDLIGKINTLIIQPEFFHISTVIDEIFLSSKTMSAVGGILNELITNSFKHAFTGRSSGEINIHLCMDGNYIKLLYSDDGIGLPGNITLDDTSSFGMTYINLQIRQLQGTVKIDSSSGTKYTILIENDF